MGDWDGWNENYRGRNGGVSLLLAGAPVRKRSGASARRSKNFTEQVVLGEIIAQHLEHRLHQKVERKLNLGGTLLAHQALLAGEIDLYPEYSGTALVAVLKEPIQTDPAAVLGLVRAEYAQPLSCGLARFAGHQQRFRHGSARR